MSERSPHSVLQLAEDWRRWRTDPEVQRPRAVLVQDFIELFEQYKAALRGNEERDVEIIMLRKLRDEVERPAVLDTLAEYRAQVEALQEQLEDYERADQAWQRNYDLVVEQKKRILEQYEELNTLHANGMFLGRPIEYWEGLQEQLEAAKERAIPPHWANIFEEHERLKEQFDAAVSALRDIKSAGHVGPEALSREGYMAMQALERLGGSNPARSPLAKAQAFVRGEVQGKCCDLWPECSHVYEAVNSEEPESA